MAWMVPSLHSSLPAAWLHQSCPGIPVPHSRPIRPQLPEPGPFPCTPQRPRSSYFLPGHPHAPAGSSLLTPAPPGCAAPFRLSLRHWCFPAFTPHQVPRPPTVLSSWPGRSRATNLPQGIRVYHKHRWLSRSFHIPSSAPPPPHFLSTPATISARVHLSRTRGESPRATLRWPHSALTHRVRPGGPVPSAASTVVSPSPRAAGALVQPPSPPAPPAPKGGGTTRSAQSHLSNEHLRHEKPSRPSAPAAAPCKLFPGSPRNNRLLCTSRLTLAKTVFCFLLPQSPQDFSQLLC